ncbi:MAG: NosD domain-containing protein [Lentisphaeria bacterium]
MKSFLYLAILAAAVPLLEAEQFIQGHGGQKVFTDIVLTRDILQCHQGIIVAADNIVIDGGGHSISGTGWGNGITCLERHNVTIKNCVISNFKNGILISSDSKDEKKPVSHGHRIEDNTLVHNQRGLFMKWSHNSAITGNQVTDSRDTGITLSGSESWQGPVCNNTVVSDNRLLRNKRGLVIWDPYQRPKSVVVSDNLFIHNVVPVPDRFWKPDQVSYRRNTFDSNLNNLFFVFSGDHSLAPGQERAFEIALHAPDGTACSEFAVESLTTSPPEEIVYTTDGNRLRGTFTPTRAGMYSLHVELTGCGQTSIDQRYWFGNEKSKTFYLGMGHRNDVGNLSSQVPTQPINVYCTMWIEGHVADAPPIEGLQKITQVQTSLWSDYKVHHGFAPSCSVEFDRTYSRRGDLFRAIDDAHPNGRSLLKKTFSKGTFMHNRADWLDLTVKYWCWDPVWESNHEIKSTVEFSYLTTSHPVIKKISNPYAWILSATSPAGSTNQADIALQGDGKTTVSLQMADRQSRYVVTVDDEQPGNRDSTYGYTQAAGQINVTLELGQEARRISVQGTD